MHPVLVDVATPARPAGVALVLHGGAARTPGRPVSPLQSAVLRMVPTAWRLRAAGGRRLAVHRLRAGRRGWDPSLTDVRWALDTLRERHGELPVALVGHSLGGRAALHLRGAAGVRVVVALAPWLDGSDPAILRRTDGSATTTVIVHGTADRVASLDRARTVAAMLARTEPVAFVPVPDGGHAMLRQHGRFDGAAADVVAAVLLGRPPRRPETRAALDSLTTAGGSPDLP